GRRGRRRRALRRAVRPLHGGDVRQAPAAGLAAPGPGERAPRRRPRRAPAPRRALRDRGAPEPPARARLAPRSGPDPVGGRAADGAPPLRPVLLGRRARRQVPRSGRPEPDRVRERRRGRRPLASVRTARRLPLARRRGACGGLPPPRRRALGGRARCGGARTRAAPGRGLRPPAPGPDARAQRVPGEAARLLVRPVRRVRHDVPAPADREPRRPHPAGRGPGGHRAPHPGRGGAGRAAAGVGPAPQAWPAPVRTTGDGQDALGHVPVLPDAGEDHPAPERAGGGGARSGGGAGPQPPAGDGRARGRRPRRHGAHDVRAGCQPAAVRAAQRDGRTGRGRRRDLRPHHQPGRAARAGARRPSRSDRPGGRDRVARRGEPGAAPSALPAGRGARRAVARRPRRADVGCQRRLRQGAPAPRHPGGGGRGGPRLQARAADRPRRARPRRPARAQRARPALDARRLQRRRLLTAGPVGGAAQLGRATARVGRAPAGTQGL
ncbi:MAG: Cell division protein FtsH, partial [uncultured Acidimicrobiales bacterium]